MKIVITLFFFLLVQIGVFGQKLKQKHDDNGVVKINYTIDRKTGLYYGPYSKILNETKDTLVTGEYFEGLKSGIWKLFDEKGNLVVLYDFDRQKLMDKGPAFPVIDSIPVFDGVDYPVQKVNSPAFFLGSDAELRALVESNMRFPVSLLQSNIFGQWVATFIIDINGNIKDTKIEHSASEFLNEEILFGLEMIPFMWIPASKDGRPVESKVYYMFEVMMKEGQESEYSTLKNIPYFKYHPIYLALTYRMRKQSD